VNCVVCYSSPSKLSISHLVLIPLTIRVLVMDLFPEIQ
jgi:hypothetical protein